MGKVILDSGSGGKRSASGEGAVRRGETKPALGEREEAVASVAEETEPILSPPRLPAIPPEIVPLRARQFRLPKTFNALRHRNFRLYIGGQLISTVGTWMQIIAQGWLVYELSRSELMLGIVGFASAVPALIVTPWGGVVVDRVPKRNLLVATQFTSMLMALILAFLVFSGLVQVWHVVALAAVLGIVNAFDGPARQAFVVDMVGREDMPNAIAINSIMFNSARIFGPAIGGLLLAQVGSAWCFLLNGLTFIAVIVGLLMMRLPAHKAKISNLSPLAQLRSGVVYAAQREDIKSLLLMAFSLSVFGITYSTVLPAFVDRVLHQGASAFGAINAASGIGAICAAVLIARNGDNGGRGVWLGRLAIFFPLVLIVFANNTNYLLSLGLAVLLGIGFMAQFTLINTLLQTNIADDMRGRVMSLYTLTFFGFTPFGNLVMGAVAERWGLSLAISLSALVALCMSAVVLLRSPKLRALA